MKLEDFFKFDKMITPAIITIIYYMLALPAFAGGLIWFIKGFDAAYDGGQMVITGLMIMVFGPVWIRVSCELVIVLFKVHTRLSSIDEALKKSGRPAKGDQL